MSRPHSTCELCRAGIRKDGDTHVDELPTGVHRFRRCAARCASCSERLLPGELYREVRTPEGAKEVHEACLG